ncbi:MAG: AAA family ATPase [Ideonella sp.]|nr:AAA family ATPase [Ideonella sp.]MCC7456518.1 AAA family ATPase [Nitrospira sp.]
MPPAALPPPTWRLQLLGQPALIAQGDQRTLPLRPKDAALMALIALAAPIKGERVAALLWPAASARQADTSLRQRLFRLRRETGMHLVSSGALLQLSAEVVPDLAATLQRLRGDEDAGRAELLGDLDFDNLPELAQWVRAERRKWREQRAEVLAAMAAACEKDGAVARGIAYSQRLIDDDPLAEHAHRRLMRLHYLRGDAAAAIAAFERLEQRLKDELGTRPSAETIELLATIERGAATLPARRAVTPASLLRPPRLIGRDSELQRLDAAWSWGRVFCVLGEAGIGKSRLLHDFVAARAGVVLMQARPGDAGITYAVLARLLRAVFAAHDAALTDERRSLLALVMPELGAPSALSGQAQRLQLQRAVETALADAMRSGLQALVVDDLHFADDASAEFLQSLLLSESLAQLRWGLAQRASEGGAALGTLRAALDETQRIEAVTLQPLSREQIESLLASLGVAELDPQSLAPALLRHTGGNPMFMLETLKDMVLSPAGPAAPLPQPTSVAALVERRLGQLSVPALKLARVAALAGATFDAELAAAVLQAHPLDMAEPWRELESAQVIRDGAFAHDLIFEATRASVPQPIGALLHRSIAAHLQARAAPPASIAPHWAGAGEWLLAGDAYAAAARRAQSASQRGHEVEYWRLAADAYDRAGAAGRAFDARCDSIHALIIVRGVSQAQSVIDTLLAAARDDAQRVAALTARATASLMAADHGSGIAAALQASQLARAIDSPWPAFEAARLHAVGLAQAARPAEALAVIEPYRERVERDGNDEQRGRFWADYAYVLNAMRRLRDTAFALQRAGEQARKLGDLAELATLTSNLATVKGNLGDPHEALALARQALALQAQLGATAGPEGAIVETYVGLYCGQLGQYREALQRLDAALACFTRDRQALWIALASNHKAQFLLELGQLSRARQTLSFERPQVDTTWARRCQMAARIDRMLGQSGQPQMQLALASLPTGGDPHVRMHVLLDEFDGRDVAAQAQRCDEVLKMATQLEFAGVAMKARLLHAHALSRSGEHRAAADAMRELVPQIERVPPADLYLGEAWWIAAQVLEANGDGDQALLALAHGAQWVRRVALPHVPDEFRNSFLQRNPVNRALLAAADRRLS